MSAIPASHATTPSAETLFKLAGALAVNYLDASISTSDLKHKRQTIADEVGNASLVDQLGDSPSRNILIVGAECSLAAFEDEFPTGDAAVAQLDKALPERPAWIDSRIEEEKQRLRLTYEYKDADKNFETHLAILSNIYSPSMVADQLAKMYGERYWPHLTFELIAHMLKHRFIDVVINFNFDELLNQAIEEELGDSQYHYIVSDGDCGDLGDVMIGERLKIPIHVKPHGTTSHRSTLRFTREQYYSLPDLMYSFIEQIVGGFTSDQGPRTRYPTNIISVGFDMQSLDFNRILRAIAEDHHSLRIYHINEQSWLDENLPNLQERTGVVEHLGIGVEEFGGIHGTLRKLVDVIRGFFKPLYAPQGIARHEIIHALFHDEENRRRVPQGRKSLQDDADYHRARLFTELIISLAKNNGRVDITSLADDRVGVYFDRLREITSKTSRDPQAASLESVRKLFERAGIPLQQKGTEGNVLSLYPDAIESRHGDWLWNALRTALQRIQNLELQKHVGRLSSHPEGRLSDWFQSLVNSEARDLNPKFGHRQLLLSRAPKPDEVLHTKLALSLKLEEICRSDWDVLLVVSEFGNTFRRCVRHIDPDLVREKQFVRVLAKNEHRPVTNVNRQGPLPKGIADSQVRTFELPYWLHNRHMLIGLKALPRLNEWRYTSAIRYDRRGLSNRVNPVFIDSSNIPDLERLIETFFGYVWLSDHYDWLSKFTEDAMADAVTALRWEMMNGWWERFSAK